MAGSPLRCPVCAVFLLVLPVASAVPLPGHAAIQYRLLANSSVGASDNPRSRPDESNTGTDGFVTAQGQVDLSYFTRLTQEQLSYWIMAISWFQDTQNRALTQTLRLSSQIETGPATTIALHANASLTQLSTLDMFASADPQTTGARPAGNQKVLSLGAGETFASQLNASWRVDQALEGFLFHPIGSAAGLSESKSAVLGASINHTWVRGWAGLRTRLGAISSRGIATQGGQTQTTSLIGEFAQLFLSWQHDWTPSFRHVLGAGAFVLRTDESRWQPGGSASLLWHPIGYEVELRAERAADTNVYVGAALERSLVGLQVSLPLDRLELLRAHASASLEHDSAADTSAGSGGSVNVISLRLGMQWQPGELFVFGLEYTLRDQYASEADSGASRFATFRRQMVVLTVGMRYPPDERTSGAGGARPSADTQAPTPEREDGR